MSSTNWNAYDSRKPEFAEYQRELQKMKNEKSSEIPEQHDEPLF